MLLGIICLIFSVACLVYSVFAFQEKGPLLTTMYFISNEEKRTKMKTKQEYRFVATTFLLISILLAVSGIGEIFSIVWISKITIALCVVLVIYAFFMSVKISVSN